MNKEIQELSLTEAELVSGCGLDLSPACPRQTEVEYPIIDNNPPG